jgi:hypothetical protein
MAMTWIRVDTALSRHPKVIRFAKMMGVSRHEGLGILLDLWTWAVDYTDNGDLSRYESDELMELLGIHQQAALMPPDLMEALVGSGFVDSDGDRSVLHDWDDYQGQLEAQREANRERQRRYRQKRKGDMGDTVTPADATVTVTSPLPNGATYERTNVTNERTARPADKHDDYKILEFEELQPITEGDCKRYRELFPAVDLDIELEKMFVFLQSAAPSKRPKASLPRFALNWLQRASKDAEKDQPISDREQRRSEQRNKETQAQLEALANTKRASTAAVREARKDMAQVFDPRKWTQGRDRKAPSE